MWKVIIPPERSFPTGLALPSSSPSKYSASTEPTANACTSARHPVPRRIPPKQTGCPIAAFQMTERASCSAALKSSFVAVHAVRMVEGPDLVKQPRSGDVSGGQEAPFDEFWSQRRELDGEAVVHYALADPSKGSRERDVHC